MTVGYHLTTLDLVLLKAKGGTEKKFVLPYNKGDDTSSELWTIDSVLSPRAVFQWNNGLHPHQFITHLSQSKFNPLYPVVTLCTTRSNI
jgi:hypothetical protein